MRRETTSPLYQRPRPPSKPAAAGPSPLWQRRQRVERERVEERRRQGKTRRALVLLRRGAGRRPLATTKATAEAVWTGRTANQRWWWTAGAAARVRRRWLNSAAIRRRRIISIFSLFLFVNHRRRGEAPIISSVDGFVSSVAAAGVVAAGSFDCSVTASIKRREEEEESVAWNNQTRFAEAAEVEAERPFPKAVTHPY